MSLLVIGATGTVGSEVVRALVARGAPVRALVRSPERAATMLPSTVELVRGDARDPQSLARATERVENVFYASPHEPDEEALAASVVAACERAAARLVFLGVHADGANPVSRWMTRQMYGVMLPHYRPKLRIAERVRASRARAVVLVATNFFQNDELFREQILAGELVTPLGPKGINRVDVRDIGDLAARILLDPAHPPGAVPAIGPASLSGEACAAIWSRVTGREVRYTGGDFDHFEREVERVLDGKKRLDILASYRLLGRFHLPTDPRQLAVTTALLGRAPVTYEQYARASFARWSAVG